MNAKHDVETLRQAHKVAKRLAVEEIRNLEGLSPEARKVILQRRYRQWKTVILREQDKRYSEWKENREVARLREDFRKGRY